MGFNKCFLPPVEVMISEIEEFGLSEFVRLYKKCDAIVGESERVDFVKKKIEEYNNILKTNI